MKNKRKINPNAKLKVLYQNLNGVWYAFAANGESVFVGKVPTQAIKAATKFSAKVSPKDSKAKAAPRKITEKEAT